MMTKFEDEVVERPEKEFTEELMEEHNYVVLYFDNKMDWQVAFEKLGIISVQALDHCPLNSLCHFYCHLSINRLKKP